MYVKYFTCTLCLRPTVLSAPVNRYSLSDRNRGASTTCHSGRNRKTTTGDLWGTLDTCVTLVFCFVSWKIKPECTWEILFNAYWQLLIGYFSKQITSWDNKFMWNNAWRTRNMTEIRALWTIPTYDYKPTGRIRFANGDKGEQYAEINTICD